jgi:hypothetical protein
MALTYPVKIQFAEYSGSAVDWDESEDWSEYLVEAPTINRRVESENEGEAGVIVFDSASVTFRYDTGNPIHDVFSIDLSEKQRYLFRISAPKSDKSYVVLYEGMADFSTITWPGDEPVISFEIIDKLSALGVLNAAVARVEGTLVPRILDQAPTAVLLRYAVTAPGVIYLFPENSSHAGLDLTEVLISPGEILSRPKSREENGLEYEDCIVIKSELEFDDGVWKNKVTTTANVGIGTGTGEIIFESPYDEVPRYYEKEFYGVDINNISGGILQSLDGLKIIEALYAQAWPGTTLTLKPSSLTYPIPSEYALRMIDNNPLGGTPLEAIKTLSESMNPAATEETDAQTGCYIYVNREGNLVIHSKDATDGIGSATYTQTIGTTKKISSNKRYFWDKLIDGAEVTVKSWLENEDGEYFEGKISKAKQIEGSGFVKPKNELTKELLVDEKTLTYLGIAKAADGTLDGTGAGITSGDQEEILIHIASYLADKYLEFYGKRRAAYDVTYKLDDNTLLWELVDNITIDSVPYFFTSLEMDLVDRTVSLTLAEVEGHPFDFRQVSVGLSEGNSVSVSSGGSGGTSGVTNISNEKNIIYVSDSVTNKATALTNALLAAKNKTLMLTQGLYEISSKIEVDLGGSDIEITSRFGSKILSTATVVTNDIEVPEGAIHITNAGTVKIDSAIFEATNAGSVNYLCGLLISDCEKVILNNVKSSGAPFSGIRIAGCDVVSVVECDASDNLYAGLYIQNSKHITILGGDYSRTGVTFPANGYGITITHREGSLTDNSNITILGVKAEYNYRKGIDVHGGVNGSIMGCHVKGFGNSGIYALAESGSDPDSPLNDSLWYKHVKDWIISDNTIENDSTWYDARCTEFSIEDTSAGADACAIFFGSYGNGVTLSPGSFDIHNNIIKNCNVTYCRGHIFVFSHNPPPAWSGGASYTVGETALSGGITYQCISNHTNQVPPNATYWQVYDTSGGANSKPGVWKIHDNTITQAGVAFTGDAVIHVSGLVHPESVEIYNNTIVGTSALGIYSNIGDSVKVHGNDFEGTFTDTIDISYDIPQRIFGNTYNGKPLPDMLSKDNGAADYYVITSGSAVDLDTIKVNAGNSSQGGYDQGIITCNVKITTTAYNLSGSFEYNVYAGNDGSTINTGVQSIRAADIIGSARTLPPVLSWVTSDTYYRTLRINIPANYTGAKIHIEMAGWRLHPKGA